MDIHLGMWESLYEWRIYRYVSTVSFLSVKELNVLLNIWACLAVSLLDVGASYHEFYQPLWALPSLHRYPQSLIPPVEGVPPASFLKQAGRKGEASLPNCFYCDTQPATQGPHADPGICQVRACCFKATLILWANPFIYIFQSLLCFWIQLYFLLVQFLMESSEFLIRLRHTTSRFPALLEFF